MTARRRTVQALAVLAALAGSVVLTATAAAAHPMGNFTRNTYAGVVVGTDRVRIDQVVDLAEVPTFQERQQLDTDGNGVPSADELDRYREASCRALAGQVHVTAGGKAVALTVDRTAMTFPPGAGGLATLRLECALSGRLDAGTASMTVDDGVFADRVGWHEVSATGDGVRLRSSDVPATSISRRLTVYPADQLSSPVNQRTAHLEWQAGGPSLAPSRAAPPVTSVIPVPGGVDAATRAFTQLIGGRQLTVPFIALALLLSIGLGALHALAPGHGKTLMAGYLVGVRGRVRDAVTIGAAVTVTHTAGVTVLGLILLASTRIAPERVYPWMGLASGVLAVGIGASLLRGAIGRLRVGVTHRHPPRALPVAELVAVGAAVGSEPAGRPTIHDHDHAHDHSHSGGWLGHTHPHPHPHPYPHASGDRAVGLPGLVSLGFAGGLVPSPSALVVLLAGFAQHRAWFALALVVGYGLGMAVALTTIGLLLVRAGALVGRLVGHSGDPRVARLAGLVPTAASCAILITGGYLILTGLSSL